jgi:hypothetical protein
MPKTCNARVIAPEKLGCQAKCSTVTGYRGLLKPCSGKPVWTVTAGRKRKDIRCSAAFGEPLRDQGEKSPAMPSAKAMDNAERAPATGWVVLDAEPAIVAKRMPINV